MGNLSELLWQLDLGGNQLTGGIPAELGNFRELRRLHLDKNRLSGVLPLELLNLKKISNVRLGGGGNRLTGCAPPAWYDLNHDLESPITPCGDEELALPPPAPPLVPAPTPEALPVVTVLTCLDSTGLPNVESNPGLLVDCFTLSGVKETLTGKGKELAWEYSVDIDQWPGVDLGGEPARVTRLRLEGMDLAGRVPPELGRMDALRELNLGNNRLSGTIPYELSDLTQLEYLNLAGNELTGIIPPELGELEQLKVLDLADNQLTEEIPPELGSLTKLEILALRDNQLSGPIPARMANLDRVTRVRLGGGNSFTGGCLPAGWAKLRPDFLTALGLPYCLDPFAPEPDTGPVIIAGYDIQRNIATQYVEPATLGEMLADLNQRVNTTTLPNLPEDAHNIFLQAGLQTGIAGIIVVALLCGSLLFNLARRDGGPVGPVECFAAAGTLMIVLHSNFEVFLFQSIYIVVWVFIGLGAGYAYTRRRESVAAAETADLPGQPAAATA